MPGRVLLLGMHVDRRRVKVKDHPLRCGARRPRTRTSACPRRPDSGKLRFADPEHHPPSCRDRRQTLEQRRLPSQRRQIRHTPPTIGQHHRQVAKHPPRIMHRAALPRRVERLTQPRGQADPIRDQRQQRTPRPRRQPDAVRPHIYRFDRLRPITFKVNLLSGWIGDSTSRSSLLRRTFQTPSALGAALPTHQG